MLIKGGPEPTLKAGGSFQTRCRWYRRSRAGGEDQCRWFTGEQQFRYWVMTETTSKIEKWASFLNDETAEPKGPMRFYGALAKANDGFYPLGANGLWHGGVHFDDATGLIGDKSEVRCIADGEVVAYRIDEAYLTSNYGSIPSVFSTGFVLVKHRLEMTGPPPPAAPAGTPLTAPTPGPSLTFFSLYMHLLDWAGYSANPALARPTFWSGGTHQVKSTADDPVLGLRVREQPKGQPGHANILTVLQRGTIVETAEEDHGWLKVVSVTPTNASLPVGSGWVYKTEMTPSVLPNRYIIGTAARDPMNPPQKGLAVHAEPDQGSATTAILPTGSQVKIGYDGTAGKYQKLLEIVSGNAIPPLTATSGPLGYVWEGLLETKNEPAEKDTVHVLAHPFPIRAGALVGHVGKYQNHSDPAPKNLLHLEVFSCEDIKAFTDQCKEKAGSLPAAAKTLLKVQKGEKLIIHATGMDASRPPKNSDSFNEVGYNFMIPVGLLEALPAEKKIKVPMVMGTTTTYTLWWHLEGLLADAAGNHIDGWLAEPDITLSRISPFAWDGFTFIDETVSNVDHLAAFLHAQKNLSEEERATYQRSIVNAGASPATQALYTIFDRNGDEKLPPEEIREALSKPWFAQPISQMITRYESEWHYKPEKWNALDELMGHSDLNPHKGWVEEKARIERLNWWSKLIGQHGITADANVQHIHPMGLMGGFLTIMSCMCKKCGKNISLTPQFMRKIVAPSVSEEFIKKFVDTANALFGQYGITTCSQVALILGQAKVETQRFTKFRESLNYSRATFTAASLYALAPTAINNGFARKGLNLSNTQKLQYIDDHLLGNDSGYGQHSFGSSDYPNNDYRGRGLLHLTFYGTYRQCADAIGIRIDATPSLAETDINAIIASGCWFWKNSHIGIIADDRSLNIDLKIKNITKKINTGLDQLTHRNTFSKEIIALINNDFGGCAG
jgi:predicted chitinase